VLEVTAEDGLSRVFGAVRELGPKVRFLRIECVRLKITQLEHKRRPR